MSDSEFPIADQIIQARTPSLAARALLRVPDSVLLAQWASLHRACRVISLQAGLEFIDQRVASLSSTRNSLGRLNQAVQAADDAAREKLADVAEEV